MPLDNDKTVGEMGFFSDVIDKLSSEAKKITKGDLINLGVGIVSNQVKKATYGEIEVIKDACKKILEQGAPEAGEPGQLGVPEAGLGISCCCCPCCCATAVIQPIRKLA
jgi:hypothetical protein